LAAVIQSRFEPETEPEMNAPDALNHPARRQILRMLIDDGEARTVGEILATGLPALNVSIVGYHARVLESAGMVCRTEAGTAGEEATYRFLATAARDPEILALLESTRDADA
jgi:DNA-binding transcriptional ArsR family regulator